MVDWVGGPHDEGESMKLQLTRLVEYLECLPLTILSLDNLEADDVISYICNSTLKDSKCTIMSADKDFYQLVDDRVQLYSPTKKVILKYDSGQLGIDDVTTDEEFADE